jgi:hypothetical protein
MEEMLNLAGVPLEEQDDEEQDDDQDDQRQEKPTARPGVEKEFDDDDDDDEDDEEQEEEDDEELIDQWDASIDSVGKVEVEFHETHVNVTYKGKESKTIEVPHNFRSDVQGLSEFVNQILSHVERVS